MAFGDIGMILYREKNDVAGAEKWFKKADEANYIIPPVAYEYGMMLYLEKGEIDRALEYLFKAADANYELAYGDIGSILYKYKREIDSAEQWFVDNRKVGVNETNQ